MAGLSLVAVPVAVLMAVFPVRSCRTLYYSRTTYDNSTTDRKAIRYYSIIWSWHGRG
jgi:hypothetical protein